MRLEERAIGEAAGTILMHNVADEAGTRVLKKGIRLTNEHLAELAAMGRTRVAVAVLEEGDVHEDEAAQALAGALKTGEMHLSRPTGGRINLRAVVDGLLEVDAERLLALNTIPGIALATRRQRTVVGPDQDTDNLATLKIVPYALARADMDRALALASARPGILEVRPFRPQRAALLLVGDEMVRPRVRKDYEGPVRARLERLGTELDLVEGVDQEEGAIAAAVARLAAGAALLVIAGQTSVMDEEDTTLRGLRRAGAEVTAVCGATKVDLVRSLGADHVIDYSMIDPLDGGQRYDLILDAGGDSGLRRLRRCLRPKGTLVIVGGERGKWIGIGRHLRAAAWSPLLSQRLKFFVSKERFEDLEALCSLIESGQVTPALDRTYPLEDAAAAIDHLASGRVRGKLALALAM